MKSCNKKDQNEIEEENNIDGKSEWQNMTFCNVF